MTSETYTWKELGAQAIHHSKCFFTAAGGNGYRLYTGTPDALTFVGFYSNFDLMLSAAVKA